MLSKRQAGSKFKTHSSKLKEWVGRGMLNACKPGSVVGGHLSRPCGRLPRRLGSCSQLSTGSASHLSRASALRSFRRLLQGGLPFSLHITRLLPVLCGYGLCCSHRLAAVPVWTVRAYDRPFPRFREAPCSAQPGLSSAFRQRPPGARIPCPTLCRM